MQRIECLVIRFGDRGEIFQLSHQDSRNVEENALSNLVADLFSFFFRRVYQVGDGQHPCCALDGSGSGLSSESATIMES